MCCKPSQNLKLMETNDKLQQIINKIASNGENWLKIKKSLEEDIKLNQELIILIDQKVNNLAKLN